VVAGDERADLKRNPLPSEGEWSKAGRAHVDDDETSGADADEATNKDGDRQLLLKLPQVGMSLSKRPMNPRFGQMFGLRLRRKS